MKLIDPHVTIVDDFKPNEIMKKLEKAARTCYQSNDDKKITDPAKLLSSIIKRGHTSVIEHVSISFRIITDRGVTHELVRHRIGCSYSQESTRYCKYDGDVQFIKHINDPYQAHLCEMNKQCEAEYNALRDAAGATPQIARQALNNNVKTEIYVTMNMRALRNFFVLRCAKGAHPYIKEIAIPFLLYMKEKLPVLFDGIPYDEEFYNNRLKGYTENMITCKCEYKEDNE